MSSRGRRCRGTLAFVLALAPVLVQITGFAAGCPATPASEDGARAPAGQEEEPVRGVRVFAGEPFYRERPEPEERIRGTLRAVEVRQGPDTREHPLELATEGARYGVYVAGVDPRVLAPFVGRAVEVTGKRVDLRSEGHGVEIWIGTISLARFDPPPRRPPGPPDR